MLFGYNWYFVFKIIYLQSGNKWFFNIPHFPLYVFVNFKEKKIVDTETEHNKFCPHKK